MVNRFKEWVSWKWKDEKLSWKDELRPTWSDKVAQEYCYEGIAHSPSNDNLWAILLGSYASEWAKLDEISASRSRRRNKGVEIDEAEVTKINAEKTGAKKKLIAEVAMGGYSRVFKALRRRSEDGNSQSPSS